MLTPQLPASLGQPDTLRAWQLLRLRRPELALRMSELLLAGDPVSLPALSVRAEALRQLGRLPEATDAARAALAQAPHMAASWYRLAQVLGQQGFLEQSHEAAIEATRLDPCQADYYGLRAQLFYLRGYCESAIQLAEDGLRTNAHSSECLLWRALAQEKRQRPVGADADFMRLLRVAPNSALVHSQLGQVLLGRGEAFQAETHLAAALRHEPDRAAELVPLLRQARRAQHWPRWLARGQQRLRQDWRQQKTLGWHSTGVALLLPFFRLWAWWLTRHDPLFQLTRVQRLRRRLWAVLLVMPLAVLALALHNSRGKFDLDTRFTLNQTAALAALALLLSAVVQLIKRRLDQENNNS